MVRGRKEPRKRRKRGKGRVEERVWKFLLEVVLRRRLKPRHNDINSSWMVVAGFRQGRQKCLQSGAVAKLAIRAEKLFHIVLTYDIGS